MWTCFREESPPPKKKEKKRKKEKKIALLELWGLDKQFDYPDVARPRAVCRNLEQGVRLGNP